MPIAPPSSPRATSTPAGGSSRASRNAFVEAYGVKPEAVQVFIHEVDHEHWAKGGRLAIDAEPEYAPHPSRPGSRHLNQLEALVWPATAICT